MAQLVAPEQVYHCLRQWSVIDVRGKEDYNRNHIEGARWMNPDRAVEVAREKFNPHEKFVLYDHGDGDPTARHIADTLEREGFTGISILEGGYKAWAQHKYPNARVNDLRANR
jgi:rhodanese-related sulfurtransferase